MEKTNGKTNDLKNTGLPDAKKMRRLVEDKLSRYFGIISISEASKEQIYRSVLLTIKDILSKKRAEFKEHVKAQQTKKIYYLCIEFLIGKSLKNNVMNLGLRETLEKCVFLFFSALTTESIKSIYCGFLLKNKKNTTIYCAFCVDKQKLMCYNYPNPLRAETIHIQININEI